MLTTSLLMAYVCIVAVLMVLVLSNRITAKRYSGWMAILNAASGVMASVSGWTTALYLNAAFAAWHAWVWWHSGGGDDTKRRLKSLGRRFQGVRRTAPSHA
jgi:ABC-type dipeptide/oligopeptide/nickel transport system permease component